MAKTYGVKTDGMKTHGVVSRRQHGAQGVTDWRFGGVRRALLEG
jgi:hypothetical protein